VAGVLLAPRTTVNFRAWGEGDNRFEASVLFPGTVAEGRGVVLNQIGGYYRIRAFMDADAVVGMVRSLLPAEDGPPIEFEALLDAPTAAVLSGILDLARERMKAAVRAGRPVSPVALGREEIFRYLTEAWGLSGRKDLISYVAVAGLLPAPPNATETVRALASLTQAGAVVEISSGSYRLAPVTEALARLSEGVSDGIQWQRVALTSRGEGEASNRIFLFGPGAPILCFAPAHDGLVWISAVRLKDVVEFLAAEIVSEPPPRRPAAGEPKAAAPSKPSPPAPASPPAAKPAPAPTVGEKAPDAIACAACGRAMKPGQKFCPRCGAPAGAAKAGASPAPTSPVCPKCGQAVRRGAKFCKSCGAALS
jgi:RNA polymerase subunit RPABC4/transcription elongation factor Spt4